MEPDWDAFEGVSWLRERGPIKQRRGNADASFRNHLDHGDQNAVANIEQSFEKRKGDGKSCREPFESLSLSCSESRSNFRKLSPTLRHVALHLDGLCVGYESSLMLQQTTNQLGQFHCPIDRRINSTAPSSIMTSTPISCVQSQHPHWLRLSHMCPPSTALLGLPAALDAESAVPSGCGCTALSADRSAGLLWHARDGLWNGTEYITGSLSLP